MGILNKILNLLRSIFPKKVHYARSFDSDGAYDPEMHISRKFKEPHIQHNILVINETKEGKPGALDFREVEPLLFEKYPNIVKKTRRKGMTTVDGLVNECSLYFLQGENKMDTLYVYHNQYKDAKEKYLTNENVIYTPVFSIMCNDDKVAQKYITELEEMLKPIVKPEVNKPKLNMIGVRNNGLTKLTKHINVPEIKDLDLHYGDGFTDNVHNVVLDILKSKDSGLIMFQGEPGTGKSTYIKYLTSLINKDFLNIPPGMVDQIAGPQLMTFLTDECQDNIIVIEDGELCLLDRKTHPGSSGMVSTVLGLGDGLEASMTNVKIIVTLNTGLEDVDEAIKRPGRLKISHEFKELSPEDSNKLAKSLGMDEVYNEPKTIAEVYNGYTVYKAKKKKTTGFVIG